MTQQQKNLAYSSPQISCHKPASDTERPRWDSDLRCDWSTKTWIAVNYMKKMADSIADSEVCPDLHSLEILSTNSRTTEWPRMSTENLSHK